MKNNPARRVSTVLATAVVAFIAMTSANAAVIGMEAAADPVGSSASGGNADGVADGTVDSPLIPPAAWDRAEYVIGRISGKELGIAAMDRRECTPIMAIHIPGSGETNEQRDPDVPHGRVVAGLGDDLTAEFGDDVRNLYLPYVSDAFLTTSYESSAAAGLGRFVELVAAVDAACQGTDFVFTGYSQGADILNAWVAGGAPSLAPGRVRAMALFGNRRRDRRAGGDGRSGNPHRRRSVAEVPAVAVPRPHPVRERTRRRPLGTRRGPAVPRGAAGPLVVGWERFSRRAGSRAGRLPCP